MGPVSRFDDKQTVDWFRPSDLPSDQPCLVNTPQSESFTPPISIIPVFNLPNPPMRLNIGHCEVSGSTQILRPPLFLSQPSSFERFLINTGTHCIDAHRNISLQFLADGHPQILIHLILINSIQLYSRRTVDISLICKYEDGHW